MLTTIALTFLTALPPAAFQEGRPVPLSAERRELAEIRVQLGADRDFTGAKPRLASLAATLAASTDPGAPALTGEVERLLGRVRSALGEAVPASLASASQDKVDAAVRAAIERGDFAFVGELGARSGPALAAAVEGAPDAFPGDLAMDPLSHLLRIDPRGGDALLERMLAHDGFLWRKRVVRALAQSEPWAHAEVLWSTDVPPRWLGTGIQHTLEKLAGEPEVGDQALTLLARLVRRGASSETFFALAEDAMRSRDKARRDTAKSALLALADAVPPDLLARLLSSEDPDLRAFSAELLVRTGGRGGSSDAADTTPSLLAHAADPAASVRLKVSIWLARRPHPEDPKQVAALRLLLADENAEVRQNAFQSLRQQPQQSTIAVYGERHEVQRQVLTVPLPDDVYRTALAHADADARRLLAALAPVLPGPIAFELMEKLAADADPQVVREVAQRLDELPWWTDPEAALRVLSALLANPLSEPSRDLALRRMESLCQLPEGFTALVRWQLAHPEVPVGAVSVDWRGFGAHEPAFLGDYAERWLGEPKELATRLGVVPEGTLLALAADGSRPLVLRLLVLASAVDRRVPSARERGSDVAAALLAEPGWSRLSEASDGWIEPRLREMLSDLDRPNPALLAMIRNPAFPAWLGRRSLRGFTAGEGAVEIGKAILARSVDDAGGDAVRQVLFVMRSEPGLRDDALLAEMAGQPELAYAAWGTIAALRDPAFLPLIGKTIEESANPRAIEALFGYMTDEAAELLLLAAARTSDAELRDRCLAHLEKIREYQDSRERWATRKARTATREQVVAQLVAQLDDRSEEVRVQAIRALATWEAVEAMPRLIELTQSGAKAVAAAAREALERLNAPRGQ